MLGTGNGGTLDLYNTCFVIQNESDNFLIDTGGSIDIVKRLGKIDIDIKDIKHIFISHSHTDHILGLIWMFKRIGRAAISGKIEEKINIYCNDVVYEAIIGVSKYILPEKLINGVLDVVDFHILEDNEQLEINGVKYTFFDINARGTKQFGFECVLNGKRLVDGKNLILYHTEDSHGDKRKGLYLKEGKENFDGVIYVPDEFDIIEF